MAYSFAVSYSSMIFRENRIQIFCDRAPYLIPSLIHRACAKRTFDCHASALGYLLFQTLKFGCVGNGPVGDESRQERIGLGAEVATSIASCGWFDFGSKQRVAALGR
jgi:hypothetical protein